MTTAPRKPTTPAPSSSPPAPAVEEEQITAGLAAMLDLAYGLQPAGIKRISQGTATDNFAVTDQSGQQHFAKIYRTREPQALELERASIELSEYTAGGSVATARATRSLDHKLIATHGHMPMSLWSYVTHTETAEGTLAGARWASAG
ncbi:aminoglycoside phosphotransferase, partial [Streptomyces parvus]